MSFQSYQALIRMDLRLAVRNRSVVFFNYLLPLVLFFVYSGLLHAERSGAASAYVVSMVLVLGIITNGLFGAGIRATQEREANILRRYRVAPITPLPLLVASLVTGLVLYLPLLAFILFVAHGRYGMPLPESPIALLTLVTVGVLAFRTLGLIVASVANSTQESQVLVQLLFLPMMFLSGMTMPLSFLPPWARTVSLFIPASHLNTGLQGVLLRHEGLGTLWGALLALGVTAAMGLFISQKLFRWEKEEKLPATSKLWVAAVLTPFFAYGVLQLRNPAQLHRADALFRAIQRGDPLLVRNARLFIGDGQVIEQGSVLVRNGKIAGVWRSGEGPGPETGEGAANEKLEILEGAGKTLLPGLIDLHVHLGAPDTAPAEGESLDLEKGPRRALASYLYAGVTAVRSTGDATPQTAQLATTVAKGEVLGPELFVYGPLFTAERGHGTEYFAALPSGLREMAMEANVRTPQTPEEARAQVKALAQEGVSGVKAVLESGTPTRPFQRMDLAILRAVVEQARAEGQPVALHTGDARDVSDAAALRVDTVEHGTAREPLPEAVLAQLAAEKIAYDPTLSVIDALAHLQSGTAETLLEDALVRQVVSSERLTATRKALPEARERLAKLSLDPAQAKANLLRAWKAGVPLVTGTDAGNFLVVHGASLHRELRLWVEAGIPATVALQAATSGAARALKADTRLGLLKPGYAANLLLVDGNPLEDISATERISAVVLQGEPLNRSSLLRDKP